MNMTWCSETEFRDAAKLCDDIWIGAKFLRFNPNDGEFGDSVLGVCLKDMLTGEEYFTTGGRLDDMPLAVAVAVFNTVRKQMYVKSMLY